MKINLIIIAVFLIFISCNDEESNLTDYNSTVAVEGTEIGNQISDYTLIDDNGNDFLFSDYRGKVLLLKFWSPTCGLCVNSMPETIEINNKYYDQSFRVISISNYASLTSLKSHIQELNMNSLINLFDSEYKNNPLNSIHFKFNIKGIPYYVIIDKYGVIRFKGNSKQSELLPLIEELLLE